MEQNLRNFRWDYSELKADDKLVRYKGDRGRITNFHINTNYKNLIPVLKEIEPTIFMDKEEK